MAKSAVDRAGIVRSIGGNTILGLQPSERLHLARPLRFGHTQLVAGQIVPLAHFLLNGALDIGEGVLGIAPARPFERLLKEAQAVMVAK